MLRPLRKPHPPLQPNSQASSSPLSHVSRNLLPTLSLEHSQHNHKSNFSFIPNPCKATNLSARKNASTGRSQLKENNPMSENTPKRIEAVGHDPSSEEVDHLSQIKFISKECSSIKENYNDDCISFSNSNNHLDDFSPLFDASEQDNSQKEEFTVEIEAIGDNRLFFPRKEEKENLKNSERLKGEANSQCGRIKKNKTLTTLPSEVKPPNIEGEILQVFKSLDNLGNSILSKFNCANDTLTTQLNYLIGSIISKIKVKNQQYGYEQFQNQFKSLINDFDDEEIVQILQNNRRKRLKKTEKRIQFENKREMVIDMMKNSYQENIKIQIGSPEFKKINKPIGMYQRINGINNKLNCYLAKNNLLHLQEKRQACSKKLMDEDSHQTVKDSNLFSKQSFHHQLNGSKTFDVRTRATQNSGVFLNQNDSRSQSSFRSDIEVIKRSDGSAFQLHFRQLNKNIN